MAHSGYLVGGPHPDAFSGKAPVGMRFPLTLPASGGPAKRPAGIAFRDAFVELAFTGPAMRNVQIVANEETEA